MSKRRTNQQAAFKLLFKKAVGKLLGVFMNNPKILENEVLLNFISHNAVAWTLVKIFTAYKYVGFLI
ncbi:hypothetical protein BH20ACI1_BH20ACI1_28020 [soil metagenome]